MCFGNIAADFLEKTLEKSEYSASTVIEALSAIKVAI